MTVGELLRKLPSSEFNEWFAYSDLEPFGEERADLRSGIVASTIASIYRKKGSRQPKPQDFMPKFGKPVERRQSTEEQIALIKSLEPGWDKLFGRDADG